MAGAFGFVDGVLRFVAHLPTGSLPPRWGSIRRRGTGGSERAPSLSP
jgi:hypothetical protein